MQPRLTLEEALELRKLLAIMRDGSRLPGERRIAMAEFDIIYEEAVQRTRKGKSQRTVNTAS